MLPGWGHASASPARGRPRRRRVGAVGAARGAGLERGLRLGERPARPICGALAQLRQGALLRPGSRGVRDGGRRSVPGTRRPARAGPWHGALGGRRAAGCPLRGGAPALIAAPTQTSRRRVHALSWWADAVGIHQPRRNLRRARLGTAGCTSQGEHHRAHGDRERTRRPATVQRPPALRLVRGRRDRRSREPEPAVRAAPGRRSGRRVRRPRDGAARPGCPAARRHRGHGYRRPLRRGVDHRPPAVAAHDEAAAVDSLGDSLGDSPGDELGRLRPPSPPPVGRGRLAGNTDLAIAIEWWSAFEQETGLAGVDVATLVRDRIEDARLWLWEDDTGAVVSLAGRGQTAAGVTRLGPVYTPRVHRRHGYGAAVTAACTADTLLRDGGHVVLFTDTANPTSNAIYQRLGYRPVRDHATVHFVESIRQPIPNPG